MNNKKNIENQSFESKKSAFLDHIRKTSEEVQKWPEWKKGEYATAYYYDLNNKKTK